MLPCAPNERPATTRERGGGLTIDARAQLPHPRDLTHDAGLGEDVVVLNPVEELGQAPERVGLECFEDGGRESGNVVGLWIVGCPESRSATEIIFAQCKAH